MTEMLLLDFGESEVKKDEAVSVRLATRGCDTGPEGTVFLTPACSSMEEFEQEITALKQTMEVLLRQARERFQQHRGEVGKKVAAKAQSPEEIWQALEACRSLEEMQQIFNSLALSLRQEVADLVFTQKNIFKGAACTFSQHYDAGECLLE